MPLIVFSMTQRALNELFHGKGAHADPLACIEDVPAELAGRRQETFPHSIAQLVFHMNYWMDYELRRIRGERPPYPEHSSESFPAKSHVDAEEWDRMRKQFASLLGDFCTLANSPPEKKTRQVESMHEAGKKVDGTLEAVLWQLVSHNSYHTGQIATLRRAFGAWPPRGGGDSW